MKRKLDYVKVLTLFGDIEFECGYCPMANDEMSVFDYITEDKIDLVRVIKESIAEIEGDANRMKWGC